jgi:PIN domain nuclease of toxin-antitoxin system
MRLLLDTHAFIWFDSDPTRLSAAATAACSDPSNELILSVASTWEMQIKARLGKLVLHRPLRELVAEQIQRNGFQIIPVTLEHTLRLETVPAHHKDPFDHLLIAQVLVEGCSLVSHDPVMRQYSIPLIW